MDHQTDAPNATQTPVVARLTLVAGGAGVYFLRLGRHLLGRSWACDLVLRYPGVSRRHALLEIGEKTATVTDQRSRNGLRLDGNPATVIHLAHGALLSLGAICFLFEWIQPDQLEVDEDTPALDDSQPSPLLTPAVRRVFTLLLEGKSEKEIATKLDLSPHTVHNHVKKIYAAYQVNSRSELLAKFVSESSTSDAEIDLNRSLRSEKR